MTQVPAGLAAEMALVRQQAGLSLIKESAESERQIAGILEDAAKTVPTSTGKGTNVNIVV